MRNDCFLNFKYFPTAVLQKYILYLNFNRQKATTQALYALILLFNHIIRNKPVDREMVFEENKDSALRLRSFMHVELASKDCLDAGKHQDGVYHRGSSKFMTHWYES